MSDDAAPFDEMEEYDSGPFCRHWGDPSDCKEMCICGHECCRHGRCHDECDDENCPCEQFKDAEP